MLTAPTVLCALPFCIVPCPVHLVGSAVIKHDLVFLSLMTTESAENLCVRDDWDYNASWKYDTAILKCYKVV